MRNLELANVWDQYDHDRKQLLSKYEQEKQHRAKVFKEEKEQELRNLRLIKARRWEIFKEQQRIAKEEQAKLLVNRAHCRQWHVIL